MNVTEELRLSCEATEETKEHIVEYIWEWINGLWTPDGKTIPTGDSYLRFWDTEDSQYVDLSLLIDTDEDPVAPLLAISQGVIVKKDLAAGGFLSSNQGVLALGSRMNHTFDPPHIWLFHSELPARDGIEERDTIPSSPETGQMFVYTGSTGGGWTADHLYRWTGSAPWEDLGHKTNWDWKFDTLEIKRATTGFGKLKCDTIFVDNFKKTNGNNWFPIGYGDTTFANQNLLQTSDAIFNSVKGTSYAGALKAGDEGTIA